jgi:hypothetical protein
MIFVMVMLHFCGVLSCFLGAQLSMKALGPMRRTVKAAAFLLLGLLFFAFFQDSLASVPQKKVLILYLYENNLPGFISFDVSLRSTLTGSRRSFAPLLSSKGCLS